MKHRGLEHVLSLRDWRNGRHGKTLVLYDISSSRRPSMSCQATVHKTVPARIAVMFESILECLVNQEIDFTVFLIDFLLMP